MLEEQILYGFIGGGVFILFLLIYIDLIEGGEVGREGKTLL